MRCEIVRQTLVDGLTGLAGDAEAVKKHLATCAACQAEHAALADLWSTLGADDVPVSPADTARMRSRFDALLEAYDAGRTTRRARWYPYAAQAAAAIVVLGIGFAAGRETRPASPDMAATRVELQDLRHMVTLSLMQQQSASDRLKGVNWSEQIDSPRNDVVQALLDTLMHDPNVNVRLASIDALERFADRETVRRTAREAVRTQMSPLVQIALIDFMVKTNAQTSRPVLKEIADDPQVHEAVRARASWGLQMIG
jgi:hypothetical protein